MPNQIKPDKEKIILNYIIEYPTHGPRRRIPGYSPPSKVYGPLGKKSPI
jgi:hypothetical protein